MKHVVTAAASRQTVLVTGFGAFPGAPRNPTADLLRALAAHRSRLTRLGIAMPCVLLPVVYADIEGALRDAVDRYRPDAILHLGLAGRRTRISVETRAQNRAGPLHPDAARRLPSSRQLVPGGLQILRATYPAARIDAALRQAGLDSALSIDAGDYVCNAALYRSLRAAEAPLIGFIHVPRVRRLAQPSARVRRSRPTMSDLTRAVLAAVLIVGRERRLLVPADRSNDTRPLDTLDARR